MPTAIERVEAVGLRRAIRDFLTGRGWSVEYDPFCFYRDRQDQWKPQGRRGRAPFRCRRMLRPGYYLEFRLQVGEHDEPDYHAEWVKSARAEGVIYVAVDDLTWFCAWFEKQFGWMDTTCNIELAVSGLPELRP